MLRESSKKIWSWIKFAEILYNDEDLLGLISTIMPPQSISGPATIYMSYHSVSVTIVLSQHGSGPEHFSTDIARKGHSFQMIRFYVVSDSNSLSFFSTYFVNISPFFSTY